MCFERLSALVRHRPTCGIEIEFAYRSICAFAGPNHISVLAVGLGACLIVVNAVISFSLSLGLELQLIIATIRFIHRGRGRLAPALDIGCQSTASAIAARQRTPRPGANSAHVTIMAEIHAVHLGGLVTVL